MDSTARTHSDAVLSMRDVTYIVTNYAGPRLLFEHLDFDVAGGQLVALTGPSGSGKTSLLQLARRSITPSAGAISVALDPRCPQELGWIPQSDRFVSVFDARLNVVAPLALSGVPMKECLDRAQTVIAETGCDAFAAINPTKLSGGELRRLALARALIGKPRLLLADEPTAGLDSIGAEEVIRLIRSRVDREGLAALISTHDPAIAAWADVTLHIRDGGVVHTAAPGTP